MTHIFQIIGKTDTTSICPLSTDILHTAQEAKAEAFVTPYDHRTRLAACTGMTFPSIDLHFTGGVLYNECVVDME